MTNQSMTSMVRFFFWLDVVLTAFYVALCCLTLGTAAFRWSYVFLGLWFCGLAWYQSYLLDLQKKLDPPK